MEYDLNKQWQHNKVWNDFKLSILGPFKNAFSPEISKVASSSYEWKESVVAYFNVLYHNFLTSLRKTMKPVNQSAW
jgi:hypothetical protein